MFYIIFFTIIAASVVVALVIVGRKLPQLTLIDTDILPKERETKRKKEIFQRRVDRHTNAWWQRTLDRIVPHVWRIRNGFRAMYGKMLVLDSQYTEEKPLTPEDIEDKVRTLMLKAERLIEEDDVEGAEKAFVQVISLDQKHIFAYAGLGDLYMDSKQYEQAREMFGYLIRLSVRDCAFSKPKQEKGKRPKGHIAMVHAEDCQESAEVHAEAAKNYAKYGETFEVKDDIAGARLAYEQAVLYEASNPRYLDLLVEACILEGDQERAREVLRTLDEVNPENQKLESLQERIKEMQASAPAKG